MAELVFSDSEVNLIATAMQRIDPMQLMAEPQAILNKIKTYAQERAQEQATAAAETQEVETASEG